MQCSMKKEDKSPMGVENVETIYFDNCAFFTALFSLLPQFCLIHFSLASLACCAPYFTLLSGVFIVLSCLLYPSQHRYGFCDQIEICAYFTNAIEL